MGLEQEDQAEDPSLASSSRDSEYAPFHYAGNLEKQDFRDAEKDQDEDLPNLQLNRTRTLTFGKLKFRAVEDDQATDWWFASTAIPLVAATFAPMANLLSIAALVVSWRNNLTTDDPATRQETSEPYPDPQWCYNLNVASLVCGFMGNLFLLFNFTRRVRYIVALPVTIILFYIASGILIAITASMQIYVPPNQDQIYSQGFWYAIIAACLYVFNSMTLMVNMVGYFLGHYPQHFTLTDEQRNLILQTMMFFLWLGGGAGVFTAVCDWNFPDALYFCDVTVLTIGFGDFTAPNDAGRGLVFPYSVGGIIILGLMVSSIHRFAEELSKDNVVRKHIENRRVNTLTRAVTFTEQDLEREHLEKEMAHLHGAKPTISRPFPLATPDKAASSGPAEMEPRRIQFDAPEKVAATPAKDEEEPKASQFLALSKIRSATRSTFSLATMALRPKQKKALIMRKEKDKFDAMRKIQSDARSFKKWSALGVSVCAFGILWCVGAVVFWQAEKDTQGMTYFQGLYFCYVSLLTIGYGDFSPKSNSGKPFFVLWSLIAIPTMTVLISGMGDTVIASFKSATIKLGDFTVLPKAGMWHDVVSKMPWLEQWLQTLLLKRRKKKGMPVGPAHDTEVEAPTLDELATEDLSEAQMTRRLTFAIRRVSDDLVRQPGKRYSYEEWADFTRLIRFTKMSIEQLEEDEDLEGVVEWDWLDENSPMLSDQTEAEWILDRLCESLLRWLKKNCIGENSIFPAADFDLSQEEREYMRLARPLKRSVPLSRAPTLSLSKQQSAPAGRSAGATFVDFFTGERSGDNAYASGEAIWSDNARSRRQMGRRRSSNGDVRRGPFAKLTHGRATKAPAAVSRTLKARALGIR